jgi:hypothetical protein
MTVLSMQRRVACPLPEAPELLGRWFAEHAEGETAVLAMRAPLTFPGVPELAVARDCVVGVTRTQGARTATAPYRVEWRSTEDGAFPRFRGTLSLQRAPDPDACVLSLDGSYGTETARSRLALGRAIRKAIAESCATAFMVRLAEYLDVSYRGVEAAKANRRAATRA